MRNQRYGTEEKNSATTSSLTPALIINFLMQPIPIADTESPDAKTTSPGVWVWNESYQCPEFTYNSKHLLSTDPIFSIIDSYKKITGFQISKESDGHNTSLFLKGGDWEKIFRFSTPFTSPLVLCTPLTLFSSSQAKQMRVLPILDNLFPNTCWKWSKVDKCPSLQYRIFDEEMPPENSLNIAPIMALNIVRSITGCIPEQTLTRNGMGVLLLREGNWQPLLDIYEYALSASATASYLPTLS